MTTSLRDLPPMTKVTGDFDFLHGSFDVVSRRLSDPLTGRGTWHESTATSVARTRFDGAVSIDELRFGDTLGMSVRVFDPNRRRWSVSWVDGRVGLLRPPVTGAWEDGRCRFVGPDTYADRPVLASYAWSGISADGGHWEQEFSTDGGLSWELNWTMDFHRRDVVVPDHEIPAVSSDFAFLRGRWRVDHQRLLQPLSGSDEWTAFTSYAVGTTALGGAASIDEIGLQDQDTRGLTLRFLDRRTDRWSISWVNSRRGVIEPPVHGGFSHGVGVFEGDDELDGRPIRVRFHWSDISTTGAHWEQAFSGDGGRTWEKNWDMRFTHVGTES